jgi:hypothetical protein
LVRDDQAIQAIEDVIREVERRIEALEIGASTLH